MKIGYWGLRSLIVLVLTLICAGAYADDTSQFNGRMNYIDRHLNKTDAQLGIQLASEKQTLYNSASLGHWEASKQEAGNAIAQASPFNNHIQFIRNHRVKIEEQLGLTPKPFFTTSYYDDKEAHYEQVLIRSDEIDMGIR